MSVFPPDQDLGPNDKSLTTVIPADHSHARAVGVLRGARATYEREVAGAPGDVIVMVVPAGKGRAFVDGIAIAMGARGAKIDTSQWSGS